MDNGDFKMKKSLTLLLGILGLCAAISKAGLITHTDYTAGSVITAAGQNTNENAIFNEFNGSINSANIATGGITSTNILDGTIVAADLSTVIQSSITIWNAYAAYHRPTLTWISTSLIDIQNNTTTANQTCLVWPDAERRCVTENTSSTNQYRRFDITATANFTGTEDSGLRSGYTRTNSTWYTLYAVKSQINSANFVIVGDTITPSQSNASALNAVYGTNGWLPLGIIAYGDHNDVASAIPSFVQTGDVTCFNNSMTPANTSSGASMGGVSLTDAAGVSTKTWTYAAGFDLSLSQVPASMSMAQFLVGKTGESGTSVLSNIAQVSGRVMYAFSASTNLVAYGTGWVDITKGLSVTNTGISSASYDLNLLCFKDSTLGPLGSSF